MRRTFLFFAFAGMIAATTSCKSIAKAAGESRMNTEIVPPDFNPRKHILMVAEMPKPNAPQQRHNGATKKLEKQLREHYPYQYEIVPISLIYKKQGKFRDTSVYKYAMINSLSTYRHTTTYTRTTQTNNGMRTSVTSPSANVTSIDFRFYDRAADVAYPLSGNGTSYLSYTVPAFVEVINKALEERKAKKK